MDGAADLVALELGELEGLRHEALPDEGGVAMQQDRHDLVAFIVAALFLLGPRPPDDDRIDDLQMARIRAQRKMDDIAVEFAVRRRAEMVFHVARALHVLGVRRLALELGEDRLERLAHEVGEHVQPPAVRHADHRFFQAHLAAALDDLLEGRDQRLAAFQPEALGADIFAVEEMLEDLGLRQPFENGAAAAFGELGAVERPLDALLDPGLLVRILDMHELDADARTVDVMQSRLDFAHGGMFAAEHAVDEDRAVPVALAETVGRRVELGMVLGLVQAQRVEPGIEMAAHPVGADQHQRADRIQGGQPAAFLRLPDLSIALGGRIVAVADHLRAHPAPGGGRGGLVQPAVRFQFREETRPAFVNRSRIAEILLVQFRDEDGIAAMQEIVRLGRYRHVLVTSFPPSGRRVSGSALRPWPRPARPETG